MALLCLGVAGIEYSLNGAPYQRYTGTFAVAPGTLVTYRAVDVNGNIEASQRAGPKEDVRTFRNP